LQDLSQCGIRLVLADQTDPDGVGFRQWRAAFYVAGETETALANFLLLLDGFFSWKSKALAREQPFEVHVHPHVSARSAAATVWDDLEYQHYVLEEAQHALHMSLLPKTRHMSNNPTNVTLP
jgi:hypothetical protein